MYSLAGWEGSGFFLVLLVFVLVVLHGILMLLVEDLAQEGTDDVQQAHGQSHHGLGDNVGRSFLIN